METENLYFAAKPANDCASILLGRAATFYNTLTTNAYFDKLARMWAGYHGIYGDSYDPGHRITFTGEQGELVSLPVNHMRNIAQHMFNMISANRPVMEAKAVNTDYKSLAQTYLANGILEYYMREKHLEEAIKRALELSIVLGSAFVQMSWNATGGEVYDYDEETGKYNHEGEIEFVVRSPFDVVFDGTKDSWDQTKEWSLIRGRQNRYNLMAKYPELSEKIRGIQSISDQPPWSLRAFSNDDTDDIFVYEFFHARSDAMPNGRYMLFASEDVIIIDIDLPYRTVPIFRIAPNDILGTPYGYSPIFDIYPIQEAINSLFSTIMTNQNAFGVQNIYVPRGADINVNSIAGAMNILEGNAKPEVLELCATPAEVFKFLEYLITSAETISGISSVTRGNPEASLRSASALALVQSMSLQFISGLQQSYVKMIESIGTSLIQILKDYAMTPKVVALVGKNKQSLLKEFVGDDLKDINRVSVDVGNPLSRCLAKDTPVLMFDGSTKLVQNIQVGEQIMGPDSYPRTIEHTNTGIEMMYEITSKDKHRNIKYGCNENHILTLKYCSDDYRYDCKRGDILDITVKDYLNLTKRQQRLLQGFTTSVEFENKEVPIPPYILGSWIGDGFSNTTGLTTMDKELVDEWQNYADLIGMKIRVAENRQPNKAKNYFITSGQQYGPSDRNPFMNGLRELELIKNKHIPKIYLGNSRKVRLELLAGLIDTDGYRIDETFIFTQKHKRTVDDVVYLCKSLGFRVTVKQFISNSSKLVGVLNSECFKISIGGNTHEIPTRLPRKQAQKKDKVRDWLNYGIEVTQIGIGMYYGFTLKEEPHFLLGDFTVTHNTIAGRVQMAEQMLQMQVIKTPEQYFQVINTGRLDSMYEGDYSELLLIKQENEYLMEGKDVQATYLDAHRNHIIEHKAVLADPNLRQNKELVVKVLDHIQEHINLLRTTDPDLLQLIGEQPLAAQGEEMSSGEPPQVPQVPGSTGDVMEPQSPNTQTRMPSPATPPPPFENLPVSPEELVPR